MEFRDNGFLRLTLAMKIAFGNELYEYLKSKGYSHLYAIGNRIAEGQEDHEDYILIPLMPEDPRIHFGETDAIIYAINEYDVKDMVQGDAFIDFYIEMTPEAFEAYKRN